MRRSRLRSVRWASLVLLSALALPWTEDGAAGRPVTCGTTAEYRVSVVVDPDWRDALGPAANAWALRVVAEASRLYEPYCLRFRPDFLGEWSPGLPVSSAHKLFHLAEAEAPASRGDFLLVLSGLRRMGSFDGFAGGRLAVVVHHRSDPARDVAVAAHELGHLLGLPHHEMQCGCIMDRRGYRIEWCPLHRSLLAQGRWGLAMGGSREAHLLAGSPPCTPLGGWQPAGAVSKQALDH